MLGNAPTRMVLCAQAESAVPQASTRPIRSRLLTLLASNHHGQDAGLFLFFLLGGPLALGGTRPRARDQVRQSRVFQNVGSSVAHIEKDLVKRAVRQIAVD